MFGKPNVIVNTKETNEMGLMVNKSLNKYTLDELIDLAEKFSQSASAQNVIMKKIFDQIEREKNENEYNRTEIQDRAGNLRDTLAPQLSDPDEWDMIVAQSWVVTGWDSGYVLIPSIKLGRDSTAPILLQIVPSRTEGEVQMMPAADIVQIEWSVYERFIKAAPWIGLLIGLAILFFTVKYAYLWWRNRASGGKPIEEIKPYIPPHITALKELKTLAERQSWNKGEAKTFHVQLSQIIRTYIDERFHISSLEKTTREVSELINTLDIHTSDKSKLLVALRLGDQIKFAKRQALSEEHTRSISVCIDFVQNTMERPEGDALSKDAKE